MELSIMYIIIQSSLFYELVLMKLNLKNTAVHLYLSALIDLVVQVLIFENPIQFHNKMYSVTQL